MQENNLILSDFEEVCEYKNIVSATLQFDVQFFSGEKTEEPTSKRKGEARSEGQVARSADLNSALQLLVVFFVIKYFAPKIFDDLGIYMTSILGHLYQPDITLESLEIIFIGFVIVLAKTVLPLMVVLAIIGVAVGYYQVGFLFTFKPLMPSLDKINPIAGMGRLFSLQSLQELAKSIMKIAVIGFFVYTFLKDEIWFLPNLIDMDFIEAAAYAGQLIIGLALKICLVMVVLGIIDYAFQKYRYIENMKMSKEEVKEEYKQSEGDPKVKAKIKEKQRQMAMSRMMQQVPQAAVVVTNPTHFAVALQYEPGMTAPVVIAKGADFLAQRIRKVAGENNVPIVENPPLARMIYWQTEIGDIIPGDLYKAVAELLAYVYRLKNKRQTA